MDRNAAWPPVIVNYRGGEADSFFTSRSLACVGLAARRGTSRDSVGVPAANLRAPRLERASHTQHHRSVTLLARGARDFGEAPRLLVARNLEPIYDIATAIRAFAIVRQRFAGARLTVAGTGPELGRLRELVVGLGLGDVVEFPGRIDNADMPTLYAQADCVLNTSTVDNMPISILEAFASGVPLVSTDAGGIPDIVDDGHSGLLAPIGDEAALARQTCRLLEDSELAQRLRTSALEAVAAYAWQSVRVQWLQAYRQVMVSSHG